MSKTITIPADRGNPVFVTVNGRKYSYPAGTEQTVPDEVAALFAANESSNVIYGRVPAGPLSVEEKFSGEDSIPVKATLGGRLVVDAADVAEVTTPLITDAVGDWLDDHPEATTTVEDGAITKAKLHADLKDEIEGDTAALAPAFSAETAYAAGDYVVYDNELYRFTASHSAGAWAGTDATKVTLGEDAAVLKSNLSELEYQVNLSFTSNAYISIPTDVGSEVSLVPVANNSFEYLVDECKKGDTYTLSVKGGSAARAWAFIDSNNVLLSRSLPNATVTNIVLTADADGYFISNNTTTYVDKTCEKKQILNAVITNYRLSTLETEIGWKISVYDLYKPFNFNPTEWGIGSYTQNVGSRSNLFVTNARRYSPIYHSPIDLEIKTNGTYLFTVILMDSEEIVQSVKANIDDHIFIDKNQYFRIVIQDSTDSTADISQIPSTTINQFISIQNDNLSRLIAVSDAVRWCAMGDSITQGYYSYYDSENVGRSGVEYTDTWVPQVARMNEWDVTNLGIGGTGFLKPVNNASDDHTTAYYLARNTDFTNFNLVTLAYGINDWKANEPIGTLADDPTVQTPTTVIQAMKATIEAVLTSNPNCKVIGILPLNCAGYNYNYGDKSTNWGLGYAFSQSGTLEQFVTALKNVYEYYGIQYIDMTHYSCVNRENLLVALPDGVHPSLTIHALMANELSKKITF